MNIILSIGGKIFKKESLLFFLFLKLLVLGIFFVLEAKPYFVHAETTQTNQVLSFKDAINIFPPKTIRIIHNNEEFLHMTYSNNVGEILGEFEIDYSENDKIVPCLKSDMNFLKVITVESIVKEYKEIEIEIPFDIERIYDNTASYGNVEIIQYGRNGIKREIYEYTYINGEIVSKEMQSSEIVAEAQKQTEKIGTKRAALEGRNCSHWNSVIDSITSDDEERNVLKHLIKCESNCNAGANNSNRYIGLLQFSAGTFNAYCDSGDIWDGESQIGAALKMIRGGGFRNHWPSCANKYCNNNSSRFCGN
jgi:hypothetical protein